ncbi:hypothetical protein HO924_06705 [Streptococcus suis]|nr:hypothetical protein [Streptococcus suis]
MAIFTNDIKVANYETTNNLFKIMENQEVDWKLLRNMIVFNMDDKKGYTKLRR